MRKLRLGVDARCLNVPYVRGMGKYVFEVASRLEESGDFEIIYFGDRPEQSFLGPRVDSKRVRLFDFPGYRFSTWEQVALPFALVQEKVDVFHATATTLPVIQLVPTVVTVHDTLPWNEGWVRRFDYFYWHHALPIAYARSKSVVTISDSSRRDIAARWPRLASKIDVIPHGVSRDYFQSESGDVDWRRRVGGEYLLYIGGALERKRFSWALRVFDRANVPGSKLVACGFRPDEIKELVAAGGAGRALERVVFLPFVPESEMPSLYRQSRGVLYPTLYEGFGLPALEAQAAGVVVLFSAVSSLEELIGPLAEVLPVDDLRAWTEACRALLLDGAVTDSRRAQGVKWAEGFSWARSAEAHREVYLRAAGLL